MQRGCALGVILCAITACTPSRSEERGTFKSPGETPFHAAVKIGDEEVVRVLLNSGADPNARTMTGSTPLHGAAHSSARLVVKLLLADGADPNANDDLGWTPLHGLVRSNFPDTVALAQLLIEAGTNASSEDRDGETPLDYAKKYNRSAIAKYLDELGASSADSRVLRRSNRYSKGMEPKGTQRLYSSLPCVTRRPTAPSKVSSTISRCLKKKASLSPRSCNRRTDGAVIQHVRLSHSLAADRFVHPHSDSSAD